MAEAVTETVRSMLLPINGGKILLPNTVVAEVIGFSEPVQVEQPLDFLLGTISWRSVTVPLVSLEKAFGMEVPQQNPRAQIAILYTLSGNASMPYVAVHMQGIPHAVVVDESKLVESESSLNSEFLQAEFLLNNETTLLPNLAAIESAFA
ncbi:MAG: chemotaxis protein CheW [Gammaproteobacteria bacterium]|nr:chemotaxis protein CheW [Gammaproteobacteria bacterium]